MTQATLTITLPRSTWIGDVSREFPSATFRVLAAVPADDAGFGLVEIEADDPDAVTAAMDAHGALRRLDVLREDEVSTLVGFETSAPLLLFSSRASGAPIRLPIEVVDGETTVEVTAPDDRLSELGDTLDRFGLQYQVRHVRSTVEPDRVLTARQRELVRTAIERGYYDTPRECTVTELAEALDIAKSTCSETLHRAEEKIVKRYAAEHLPDSEPTVPSK